MGRKLLFNTKKKFEKSRQKKLKKKVGRPYKRKKPAKDQVPSGHDDSHSNSPSRQVRTSTLFSDYQEGIDLPSSWSYQYGDSTLSVYKIAQRTPATAECPAVMTHCITIHQDLTWEIHIHNKKVDSTTCHLLSSFSGDCLTRESLKSLVSTIDNANVCSGHPDEKFCEFLRSRKGKLIGRYNQETAFLDSYAPVECNGTVFQETVRSKKCIMLSTTDRCNICTSARAAIRNAYNRHVVHSKSSPSQHLMPTSRTKLSVLTTPQRIQRVARLREKVKASSRRIQDLEKKIQKLTKRDGVNIDPEFENELASIISENTPAIKEKEPEDSFRYILWQQQLQTMRQKNPCNRRWHPAIVRWCLHLKLISSSAYNAVASSGFLTLPSQRTLRDYTHYIKSEVGFQAEVNAELVKEANVANLKEHEKCVGIIFDEMKIKDKLVYNKNSGNVIGWVDLGDFNNEIAALERESDSPSIATHMLIFMVRGIFSSLQFPLAQFPTDKLTGVQLFSVVWDAVRNVESCGLMVKFLTADGASMNRLFFKMCRVPSDKSKFVYRTLNPFSSDKSQYIYLISDIPHLLKTARNCWSHSFAHDHTRALWNNGKHISWVHLVKLVGKCNSKAGLNFLNKIKDEHLHLTSFSRMRVNLAAQVLSSSVANAFQYFNNDDTTETEKFVRYFDKFFDCCNTKCTAEWSQKRKPDLKPYSSSSDERLEWLEKSFLGYIDDWEKSIAKREVFTSPEKAAMCLSSETLTGLRISVTSIVKLTRELLDMPGSKFVLTERFCQDPAENFFGKQRGAGNRCDNPTVQQFLHNTTSLRVQRSMSLNPIYGNCRSKKSKRSLPSISDVSQPLSKRKRTHK